jgi:acetyl esterase
MLAAMAMLEMDVAPPPSPVTAANSIEELLAYFMEAEAGFNAFGDFVVSNTPPTTGIISRTEVITGVDGNEINLYIHRPDGVDGPMPCIVHTHGGGMAILKASNPNYSRWRDDLAATGMVVVGVEFRNAAGELGPHPFPSGGGNLSIATALKAKQDGWISDIAGVYAQCPYISNAYAEPIAELVSLFENDNYFLNVENMGAFAKTYSPDGADDTNPLAWPMHAESSDLEGLPPHVISVNQLDPLRDEGLVYYRKLLDAGVSAVSRTVNGTCHAGDCLFLDAMPDVWHATIRDIKGFADSL